MLCRSEALDFVTEMEAFIVIHGHLDELRQRKETRRAVRRMLALIAEIAKYLQEHTSNGIIGK